MKVLSSRITIGDLVFPFVNQVSVESSWEDLTDTCVIRLPKRVKVNKKSILSYIQTGMPVKVELGYDGVYHTEFEGFVARSPKPTIPIEIECEDPMWKLKQTKITKHYSNIGLKALLQQIAPGYPIVAYDFVIPDLRVSNGTPAQVLKEIADTYGFRSFFRNGTLITGVVYGQDLPEVVYHLQENVVSNTLEYRRKEDIKIKIEAISIDDQNQKIETEVGDADGEARTLTYYNLSLAKLKTLAEEEIDKLKVDGYSGDLTGFGVPFCQHGWSVRLIDQEYEERDSSYFIRKTSVEFGENGFRRTVYIDRRAS